ncbi:hypothetical protein DPMN_162136 [Dreissena polymorpha]|uniref:Uncharacterized protein n=1 Tax=Dreissena polymorpha TaxID=45954 RepID=A0A9D4ER48_DREPO|nr:hypothetical protein DPMN_162136 [Dreissena polymorpha]
MNKSKRDAVSISLEAPCALQLPVIGHREEKTITWTGADFLEGLGIREVTGHI